MTGAQRQALRRAISQERLERVRRSGGWESDEQRQEVMRSMQRRADEKAAERVRELELERDALLVKVSLLEAQRDRARRELRLAESWIHLAYGHTMVGDRPAPRRYATEEARIAARRKTWRESNARRRLRKAAEGLAA